MRRCRVAFLHPDLGLGGAERLVVDAAVELAKQGHSVDMYTAYYDPERCFDETRSGQFAVITAGNWFPRHVLGRFIALCAIIRCTLAALYLAMRVWSGNIPDYDVIIVDQVAAVVPLLKMLLPGMRVLFYCHFPDLLLSQRASVIKSLYRMPLDYVEQSSTGTADLILVNSNFTAGVFGQTFKRLTKQGVQPAVLYPAVAIPPEGEVQEASKVWKKELSDEIAQFIGDKPVFLSINRCAMWRCVGWHQYIARISFTSDRLSLVA
jgi:alpha-1,3/alpha-1,6-mannosyltransferase